MMDDILNTQIWDILISDELLKDELKDLQNIGSIIWQRGWAEANAGNVSLRLPKNFHQTTFQLIRKAYQGFDTIVFQEGTDYTWFLVSASGSRYREFVTKRFLNFVLIAIETELLINDKVSSFIVVPSSRKPTSEVSAHIKMHTYLMRHRPAERIILHAHSTEWIALSGSPDYRKDSFNLNKELHESLPEMQFYFPHGIVYSKYATPGSEQLARVSESAIEKSNIIIWEKHGVVIAAENITQAYDFLEILNKAATVYLMQKSAGIAIKI